jgi:hypothetical protein
VGLLRTDGSYVALGDHNDQVFNYVSTVLWRERQLDQHTVTTNINSALQSATGVNTDQELTNMVMYQMPMTHQRSSSARSNLSCASASDSTADQALSQEVLQIKQEIMGLASTTYNNRQVFSGTHGTAPYPQGSAARVSDPASASYDPSAAYAYSGSANLQEEVGNISDANEAEVLTELDLAETSYQAALETTAKIIQPSLARLLS